jgi:HEAT repeat protein
MLQALGVAALILTALSASFLFALVGRRMYLAREERRRAEMEQRLKPLALALTEDDQVDLPVLPPTELAVLADVVGRYSRRVTGDSRNRIAGYFAGTGAVARELRALRDRRAWRRATAAYRLGDMACRDAGWPLVSRLSDRDSDVRASAARSLGQLRFEDGSTPLVRALVDGTVPRAIAFRALLDIGGAALPELRRLARDENADLRGTAVELIGWLGDAADADLLVAAMEDSSAEVRSRVAAALGRLAETEGAAALTRALDDRIYFVRLHAARALGHVGERVAVERLLRQAREDRFEAARAAAEAVALIDPDALVAAAELPDAGPHLHEAADLLRV